MGTLLGDDGLAHFFQGACTAGRHLLRLRAPQDSLDTKTVSDLVQDRPTLTKVFKISTTKCKYIYICEYIYIGEYIYA